MASLCSFKYLNVWTTYCLASKLRSDAVNLGFKKLYIVELTRSQGDLEKQEDLLFKSDLLIRTIYVDSRILLASVYWCWNQ